MLSANEYDWLGDGVYFFQDAPRRASDWAAERHDDPCVLEAKISLASCIDLLDTRWFSRLNQSYDAYVGRCKRLGIDLPRQTAGAHRLDRDVINYMVDALSAEGRTVKAVRGAFGEGRPAFPGSALYDQSHVQIAVRELDAILSVREYVEVAEGIHDRPR